MSSLAPTRTFPSCAETSSGSSPFFTVRILCAFANFAESHGCWLFAAISVACGWVRMHTLATRFLGHDELFTFYIAQAPTLRQLFKLTQTVDLHPPLSYLLVRASFAIFGVSAWSCRLPFLLAFLLAAAVLFWFVQRLLSSLHALVAVLFLWSSPFTYQADEARPYSMLLCFTIVMLVSWHWAIAHPARHRWALLILTASGFALLLSHVLGVLPFAAFVAAELIRIWIRRKPDWRLWASILIPSVSVFMYLPLIHAHSTLLYAREYRATPLRIFSFYWDSFRLVATPLALIAVFALLWPLLRKGTSAAVDPLQTAVAVPFGFLLTSFALIPLAVGIVFAQTGTAFFDRYGVVWLIPFALAPTLVLGYRTCRDPLAGASVALLLAAVFFLNTSGRPWLLSQLANLASPKTTQRLSYIVALFPIPPANYPPVPSYLGAGVAPVPSVAHLDAVEPGLPIVAHTGLTFMELGRQEGDQVTQRLFMLTDEKAAAEIAHDTVFAHYEQVKEAFPQIRGTVEPYCSFVSAHHRFLVVGAYNHPQGWLLRKLDREGAQLRVVGKCADTTEGCQIYEVSLPNPQCSQP